MGFLYISFLALIQGITEFLPVSSSGHLVLISQILNKPEHNLHLDVSVHFGTLLAVILFYRKDVLLLASGFSENVRFNFSHKNALFFRLLIIATIPVIILGLIFKLTGFVDSLRSIKIVGLGMLIFSIFLYLSDKYGKKDRIKSEWSYRDAIFMGLWQSVALIPGTSRSGNTITGALILGFSRESSTNLSMIMSIPTILASSVLLSLDLTRIDSTNLNLSSVALAVFLSFIAALLSLSLLIRFIRTHNFTPFIIYRVSLGIILLYLTY